MTSYILREPAYHKSAKLSAKLARIDNLGFASDIRLQSAYDKQTFNQSPSNSNTVETQTEQNPVGRLVSPSIQRTQMPMNAPIPTSTVADRVPPPRAPIVGATSVTPTPVRTVSTEPLSPVGALAEQVAEQARRKRSPKPPSEQWSNDILEKISAIMLQTGKTSVLLNSKQGGHGTGVKLYDTSNPPQEVLNFKVYAEAVDPTDPRIYFSTERNPRQKILTPASNKFGDMTIDIKRLLNDYMEKRDMRMPSEFGVGLKSVRKPIRKNIDIHWEDRIMAGDANYVLRNPFLSGRISYYPYGAHMNQILIRQPSRHALNIVRDLIENHTFKQEDYDKLRDEEGDKINQIIKLSKVVIPHDVRMKGYHLDDIVELKQRYKVLVGEIGAGNHGELVLEEMRDIVKQLAKYRAISEPTKRKMLGQINAVK
jgi:hypothetical protein